MITIIGKMKDIKKMLEQACNKYGHLPADQAIKFYLGRN